MNRIPQVCRLRKENGHSAKNSGASTFTHCIGTISAVGAGGPANDEAQNILHLKNAICAGTISITFYVPSVPSADPRYKPNLIRHLIIHWVARIRRSDWF